MLLLISPAKTLDFITPSPTGEFTQPDFLKQSRQLIKELRHLSAVEISTLMSISDKLGELNFQRFASWHTPFTEKNAKQALFAFQGDVYTGMMAEHFSADDIQFAQQHLRILSGLYGLLRPLDLIQPYRLEMGTRFAHSRGKNLYDFWDESITRAINDQLQVLQSHRVVNLASTEYFSAVKPRLLNAEIITPIFKDQKNGQYKIISFFAKKARGLMSAYIIQNRITEPEAIKQFDIAGYGFNAKLSSERDWVFTRAEAS
ncbi:MAG TPA: peroxide stress protein YaaA [Cellvibrio sp.]|nr:peroxide stress protein YaaA [Cellvibrio sp.]